jgi:hypothetical protein
MSPLFPHPNILIDREVTHDDASVSRIMAAVTHLQYENRQKVISMLRRGIRIIIAVWCA